MQIRTSKPLVRHSEPVRELIEALTHQGRQDGLTVGEVVIRRLVRAAGATRMLSALGPDSSRSSLLVRSSSERRSRPPRRPEAPVVSEVMEGV